MNPYKRNLDYYENIDKVYWVPVKDICPPDGDIIKANTPTPFIYVESTPDQFKILQFDMDIEFDKWRYTAWSKVLGKSYDIRVEVLLI
jgi:protein associated with RNAse G/E